jgi:hypothetical protein
MRPARVWLPRLQLALQRFRSPVVESQASRCPAQAEAKTRCREAALKKGPFPTATSLGVHRSPRPFIGCSKGPPAEPSQTANDNCSRPSAIARTKMALVAGAKSTSDGPAISGSGQWLSKTFLSKPTDWEVWNEAGSRLDWRAERSQTSINSAVFGVRVKERRMSTMIRRLSLRAHPHFSRACESRRITYLWRCHGTACWLADNYLDKLIVFGSRIRSEELRSQPLRQLEVEKACGRSRTLQTSGSNAVVS